MFRVGFDRQLAMSPLQYSSSSSVISSVALLVDPLFAPFPLLDKFYELSLNRLALIRVVPTLKVFHYQWFCYKVTLRPDWRKLGSTPVNHCLDHYLLH